MQSLQQAQQQNKVCCHAASELRHGDFGDLMENERDFDKYQIHKVFRPLIMFLKEAKTILHSFFKLNITLNLGEIMFNFKQLIYFSDVSL